MSRQRLLLTAGALMALASSSLLADTVYLQNGATIDGVVLGRHQGILILQIGNIGKMEIAESEIVSVESNARTGPVDRDRRGGRRVKADPIERPSDRKPPAPEEPERAGPRPKEAPPLDPELRERIESLVYDLTRQRATVRTRAEAKLIGIGAPALPFVREVASHPGSLTRIAAFRILKRSPELGSVETAIAALTDENRFVRKLAWETLRLVSGKNWLFPWDDSATDRERQAARVRWTDWWKAEQARLEKEAEKAPPPVRSRSGEKDGDTRPGPAPPGSGLP